MILRKQRLSDEGLKKLIEIYENAKSKGIKIKAITIR